MTRVLHVLDHSLPMHSGYTFRTRAILKAQQALGYDVRGITGLRHTAEGPAAEEADGLLFHRTAGTAGGPVGYREWREIGLFTQGIDRVVRDWRPDILHAHSPALCGQAALRVARRHGIPLVYEIRAFWEDAAVGNGTGSEGSLKYRLTRKLESHVVREADAMVTICEGLRRDLIARGTPEDKITVMPNGVDLALFGQPPERDAALGRELGFEIDGRACPVIGFIGSFYDYEGLDILVEAMPGLVASQPDARLLLVGGGPMEAALRAQAEASPAADAIRFIGRVPHHQVDRYYALCDVMAYPRKRSRLTDLVTPLKPLEAMAQGKLVAASDVGGHRELIDDGVTGTLFAPDDAAACAAALAGLLERRDLWDGYRRAGREHVEKRHDWAVNARRYQDVYQMLSRIAARRGLGAAA
ncbi:TIGR04063 family PEP-CTERM/XrtA system glycosyltransferase [Novosphingobium mangrovi (ex Huang et al. 2023)]|uniref:Glycosyltransferase, exosortase A system-associated n=1 Tax=Novosphingobium mangrovi (ex Huang et al. 2023) TaxID=2976432 RepID=A0ABT2I9U5_9SPHN|nr:TIGR04063 family PEP-CTERM/XrtA system glycosyltransferase [Novosphingobium mangrovi (ex Huang et al. 2023)]MCT2401594.1 glycosyltransferase, exosortase A system-associated [Novosphingobium mangrovi (ex Huang et al. 2023)]